MLEVVRQSSGLPEEPTLWGRKELEGVTEEATGLDYNEHLEGSLLMVNAGARPSKLIGELCSRKGPFVALAGGRLLAARVGRGAADPGVLGRKQVKALARGSERLEAPADSFFRGYWDLVESNGVAIAAQAGHFEDPLQPPSSVEVRGPAGSLRIDGGAEVEKFVTFDTRRGPIVVSKGALIESFSRVMGPCYIGPKVKVLSALIGGGTSIFEGCKVGGQIENSVVQAHTNKAHHGYVGDSYVGEWVNLGAGSTFSNLKNTYGNVRVQGQGSRTDSGMLKLGPAVGDMCKVSIGALVHAGRTIGAGSQVSGLARASIPPFIFYDGETGRSVELLLESVVETQRRMMERRDITLTRAAEGLIRLAFKATSAERRKFGARKGALS